MVKGMLVFGACGYVVLVGVLIMAALGYGLDQIFRALERHIVHWSGKE